MKLPLSLGLPALTTGLLLTASAALAEPLPFDEVDSDGDGFLSDSELTSALGSADLSHDFISSLDQNADGRLSRDELLAVEDSDDNMDDGDEEENEEGDDDGEGSPDGGFDRGEDGNHGHGDDEDGFDNDNPGRGHGDDGIPGGGRRHSQPGHGHGGHGGGEDD